MYSAGSGHYARESADGRSVLYISNDGKKSLLMMPLTGGPAQSLVPCVDDFDVAGGSVYYVACGTSPGGLIHRLNPATAEDTVLGALNVDNYQGTLPCLLTGPQSCTPDE